MKFDEAKTKLGDKYRYHRFLTDGEMEKLRQNPPPHFKDTIAAQLTAGCLQLKAVLYRAGKNILSGYDLYVKDDPNSSDWIFYDGISSKSFSSEEAKMFSVLEQAAEDNNLSFTECCFASLEGKVLEDEKLTL